ncbi:MAG: hypothetical protein EPO25_01700 [Gammaproteobacteria bacterium]|nr:MAG: hypothetical protein EPO25_01700 [Gammaproteobacteria bacterium]
MPTSNMSRETGYAVGVNPDAMFSVSYQDERGKLIFAIEVDDTPRTIYLNPRPTEGGRALDPTALVAERVKLAVERVKAYFEDQGFSVEID